MKLFRREPSADDSLVSVATARGWVETARSGQAMLPPSHVDGDPHDLNSRRPPGCGGRAFEGRLPCGASTTVSHLEIYRNDTDTEVYDVVQWRLPAGASVARFEVLAGADLWGNHRLTDRFGHPGSRKITTPAGKLRVARAMDDSTATRLEHDPDLVKLFELGDTVRNGFVGELVDERAAIFSWNLMAHRGTERWHTLFAAAEAFERLLDRLAAN